MAISGAVLIGGILAVGIGVAFSQFGKSPKDEADKLAAETDNVGDQQDAAMEALNAAQKNLEECEAEGLSGAALQECAANWDTAADNLVAVIEQGKDIINKGINDLIAASGKRKESVDVSLDGAESEAEIQEITDKEAAALVDDLAALRAADEQLRLLDRPLVVSASGEVVRSTVFRAAPGEPYNRPKTQAQLFPDQILEPFPLPQVIDPSVEDLAEMGIGELAYGRPSGTPQVGSIVQLTSGQIVRVNRHTIGGGFGGTVLNSGVGNLPIQAGVSTSWREILRFIEEGDLEDLLRREREHYAAQKAAQIFDDLTDLRKLQELALHSSMNRIHDPQYGFGTKYTLRVANAIMAIQQSGVVVPNDWEDEGTPRQTAAHTAAVILSQRSDWEGYEQHIFAMESGWDDD